MGGFFGDVAGLACDLGADNFLLVDVNVAVRGLSDDTVFRVCDLDDPRTLWPGRAGGVQWRHAEELAELGAAVCGLGWHDDLAEPEEWQALRFLSKEGGREVSANFLVEEHGDFPVGVGALQQPQVLWDLAGRAEKFKDGAFAVLGVLDHVIPASLDGVHFRDGGGAGELGGEEQPERVLKGGVDLALGQGVSHPLAEAFKFGLVHMHGAQGALGGGRRHGRSAGHHACTAPAAAEYEEIVHSSACGAIAYCELMSSGRPSSRRAALVSSIFCLEMPPSGATSTVSFNFSPLAAANLDRTAV